MTTPQTACRTNVYMCVNLNVSAIIAERFLPAGLYCSKKHTGCARCRQLIPMATSQKFHSPDDPAVEEIFALTYTTHCPVYPRSPGPPHSRILLACRSILSAGLWKRSPCTSCRAPMAALACRWIVIRLAIPYQDDGKMTASTTHRARKETFSKYV